MTDQQNVINVESILTMRRHTYNNRTESTSQIRD